MNKRYTILMIAAIGFQTLTSAGPALADRYDHAVNQERKAARQQADANFDASIGRFHKAHMHERKAFRDERRAWRNGW